MKTEVNPKDTSRAEAFELWMSSPMPMVTLTKTFDDQEILDFMTNESQLAFLLFLCGGAKGWFENNNNEVIPTVNKEKLK